MNLPDPVQPHVTYRDIGIRLTITSTLPDIETILDETLGAPLAAQQTTQPQPTTTSINRGDRNTSIDARATGQQTQPASGEIQEPAPPRTPFVAAPRSAAAQPRRTPTVSPEDRAKFAATSDVCLEVPDLHVDQILLDVDNLNVHLSLDSRVANLVSLKAGVDARSAA